MANFLARRMVNGLGTFSISVPEAGTYQIQGNITLPKISQGATVNSAVVVTININGGGAIYTGPAGQEGFRISSPASASDVFNIILSSAATVDQSLNVIKTTITLSEST